MWQYLELLADILDNGTVKTDRTGVGTKSVFGRQLRFDLSAGFPLVTTKRVYTKGIVTELLWFISGSTNIRYLAQNNVNIWNEWPLNHLLSNFGTDRGSLSPDEWQHCLALYTDLIREDEDFAKKWGELGPVYGYQWRHWQVPGGSEIDQLDNVLREIKNNPSSRRLIVMTWNPADIEKMKVSGLPPCHMCFQFDITEERLSCQMYIRSWDVFLGGPFNIASYALLTLMVAHVTGLNPGDLVITSGDTHLYLNHLEKARRQLTRTLRELPTLRFTRQVTSLYDFKPGDIEITGYDPHPAIKAEIAI